MDFIPVILKQLITASKKVYFPHLAIGQVISGLTERLKG
jgi:hypothetical protein